MSVGFVALDQGIVFHLNVKELPKRKPHPCPARTGQAKMYKQEVNPVFTHTDDVA